MSNKKNPAGGKMQIKDIMFSGEDMCVIFKDSSRLVVPIAAVDFLENATLPQRCNCNPCDGSAAIRWDDLDRKITLEELLAITEK